MNNKRGMALIVALMTSFILLALVASLFWIIASTSRQAEYAKNSAIALNLAEAGTADAIYRLNYTGTDGASGTNYPFELSDPNPFGTSILVSLPIDILNDPPYTDLIVGNNAGIFGTLNNGNYYVGLINDNAGPDTIIAVGVYKGVRRILTVPLRGNNVVTPPTPRQGTASTQGISEAFNKHVIYANIVNGTAAVNDGNIVYTTDPPPAPTGTNNTKTKIDPALFGVPAPVDISSDITTDFGIKTNFTEYYENGWLNGVVGTPFPLSYGTYVDATDTYNFSAATKTIANSLYIVGGVTGNPSPGGTVGTPSGKATFTNTTIFSNFFKADGLITLSGAVTVSTTGTLKGLGGITINSAAITGSLAVRDSNLSFSTATSSINSSGNTKKGAVMLYDTLGNNSLTINAGIGPTITLKNDDSQAAIIVYSTVAIPAVTINDAPQISLASGNQPVAIVAYSTTSTANIAINTPGDTINGLIYAGSGGIVGQTATITLTSGTVTGSLVAGGNRATGTINLNGGILNYVPSTFQATNVSDIYQGFSGGLRVYVPTWQGWKLR